MKQKNHIVLLICLFFQMQISAQSVKDSCIRIIMMGFHASGQLPQYDLAKRYGPNLNAGASIIWKTKHNVLYSLEGSYFFGKNVREDVVFSKLGNNPNSGVFITVGIGWMQHKIKLYDANQKIAAVNGDLKKGYDRLSGGLGFSQFIGYKYISNNRLANCYAGFEFYEARTKSLRGFNYDTGLPDTQKRFDMLVGFRFGWILPLYKRKKDFYYF